MSEIKLKFFPNDIDFSEFRPMADEFNQLFLFNGRAATRYEKVSIAFLQGLKAQLPAPPEDQYISILRIYYGLKDNQLIFIYSPVYAVVPNPLSKLLNLEFSVKHMADPDDASDPRNRNARYFIYPSLTPETFSNVVKWTTDYRDNLQIKDAVTGAMRAHDRGGTVKGDAVSAAFPFQELGHFFPNVDEIYVNSLSKYYPGASKVKHTIALSEADPDDRDAAGIIADLATLCPVNCNDAQIRNGVYVSRAFLRTLSFNLEQLFQAAR